MDSIELQPNNDNSDVSLSASSERIFNLLINVPMFVIRFIRLLLFCLFLLPGSITFVWHYLTCDRKALYYGPRNSEYKDKNPSFSRQYIDVYGSQSNNNQSSQSSPKPVVIFVCGGAWTIGYKMWATLLARALVPFNIIVCIPDYRNFPGVNIKGMVHDIDTSIQWVFDNIERYGGNKNKVVLAGQSAGAHIGGVVVAMKVLDWIRREGGRSQVVDTDDTSISSLHLNSTYAPHQLCGFISTSSPSNLVSMRPIFHQLGLSEDVQRCIFGDSFETYSPYHLLQKSAKLLDISNIDQELRDIVPAMCVIHGTEDNTVPVNEAYQFISLLKELSIPTEKRFYSNWSHTDPIFEEPYRGNHLYHRDVYELVCSWTNTKAEPFDETKPILKPICPSLLVGAARFCNPF